MPNQRASDRTNISFWADGDFLAMIEMGRKKAGRGVDRSQFIRDAIKEKLVALGYDVPDIIVLPPDRARPVKADFIYAGQQQSPPQELRAAETPPTFGEPAAEAPPKPVRYPKSKKPKP